MASADLRPGTKVRHRGTGSVAVLDRRKQPDDDHHGLMYRPGWWLRGRFGGLADDVIDAEDSDWEVLG